MKIKTVAIISYEKILAVFLILVENKTIAFLRIISKLRHKDLLDFK